MPGHAWNIAASVLRDVAYGEYENPFDFGDVGYLAPRPVVDIGVEILGELLIDRPASEGEQRRRSWQDSIVSIWSSLAARARRP